MLKFLDEISVIFLLVCGKVEVSYKILCPLWIFYLLWVLKRIPVKLIRIKVTVNGRCL